MNQIYSTGQQEAAKVMAYSQQNVYSGSLGAQTDRPPQPTRFSSCAGRLEAQVSHLFSCIERVSRVADRLGGSVPQEGSKPQIAGNGSNVALQLEEQNERFDTALKTFMHTLERLEQL